MITSNRKRTILGLLAVTMLTGGCSGLIKGTAVEGTTLILQDAQIAFFEEEDYTLAKDATPSNLKLIEGLIKAAPEDERLLLSASQLFGSYAFGFIEEPQLPSFTGSEPWAKRASIFYKRGMGYGMRVLERNDWFKRTFRKDMDGFANIVRELPEKDLPALFWTAYNWANWINLNKSDPAAISDLAWVELMMNRAKELDETYHHGGPLLFQMVYFGSRGEALGGSPEKSQKAYEKARAVEKGKFLLVDVLHAQNYAVQTQNKELFTKLLTGVIEAPDNLYPEQRLPNEIAKVKARALLDKVDEFF